MLFSREIAVAAAEVYARAAEQRGAWDARLEALIVDSTSRAIEHLCRNPDGTWPENPAVVGEADTLTLSGIGLPLTMTEVYVGTSLDVGATR